MNTENETNRVQQKSTENFGARYVLWISIGVALGVVFGASIGKVGIGIIVGIVLGSTIGLLLGSQKS